MRSFVGIELEESIREHLVGIQAELREEFPDISWLEADQLFLTLKFLGSPHPKKFGRLKRVLHDTAAQVVPFEIKLGQTGCFPDEDPVRTIWVGVEEESMMLNRFQKDCENEFSRIRIRREEKAFLAHITLGRVSGKSIKRGLRTRIVQLPVEHLSQRVTEACLVHSKLSKSGPNYKVVYRAPFTARVAS